MHGADIKPFGSEQCAIALDDAGDVTAIFLLKEFGGVIADIAKPLHDHPLAVELAVEVGDLDILGGGGRIRAGHIARRARLLRPARQCRRRSAACR